MQCGNSGTLVDQPDGTAYMGSGFVDGLGNDSIGLRQQEAREEGIGSEQALTGSGDGLHQILEQHGKVCLGLGCLGVPPGSLSIRRLSGSRPGWKLHSPDPDQPLFWAHKLPAPIPWNAWRSLYRRIFH